MTVIKDDRVILERFEVGVYLVNAYLIGCARTKLAAVVDPGAEGEHILERARELGLSIQYIANTHGHIDHIADNGIIKRETGARIIIHPLDASMLTNPHHNLSAYFSDPISSPPADEFFQDGGTFQVGELAFEVMCIPGHSPGSVCLLRPDFALVGDVLFAGSVGRSDFPGGSHETLIRGITEKLLPRGDQVRIFPGHGPDSTLGIERRSNPFLLEFHRG